jgi:two-component system sensor histidine kinase BaeS
MSSSTAAAGRTFSDMKPGITSKLFLAILATCIVVAVAMAMAVRYSFNQGFIGYLNEQESQRLDMLSPTFAKAFQEHGSWDFVRDKPRVWFGMLRPPGMAAPRENPQDDQPPGTAAEGEGAARAARPPRPVPPDTELTGLSLRVSLLDEHRNLVIGNPRPGPRAELKPIEVGGSTVGWLALVPFQQVSTGAALRFQEQQSKTSWIIGGIVIVLAAMVAWLLARMFLAPLKRIAVSTHRLASGDYAVRVPANSGDELGQLARDFNHLALTLEKNEKLRRAFVADVSHELRTPLSVLKGELEAIEDGVRPMSPATVQSLQAEVATLGKLVNDLYELSLSDAGALSYRKERTDVLDVLRLTAHAFADRFAEKDIRLEQGFDGAQRAWCDADPDRLRQLFNNILENALRYTDAGGCLRITASVAGRNAVLHFQDTKPGVPSDLLPHLFERFYRVEASRNRATGGAGLGLAICRNIVEAHQGTIEAKHSPLGGLWMEVSLPLAA